MSGTWDDDRIDPEELDANPRDVFEQQLPVDADFGEAGVVPPTIIDDDLEVPAPDAWEQALPAPYEEDY
jgi:hypothetical protein